jgi:hypothetical protein
VPHQVNAIRSYPRRPHLTAEHRPATYRGLFFYSTFSYKHRRQHGDSHEKWKKEKSLDISTGSRAEDYGPQENPRRSNCPKVETDRRSNTTKSIQYRIVARLALTNRRVEFFGYEAPPRAGLFLSWYYDRVSWLTSISIIIFLNAFNEGKYLKQNIGLDYTLAEFGLFSYLCVWGICRAWPRAK